MTDAEMKAHMDKLDDLFAWADGLPEEVDGINLLQYKMQVGSSVKGLISQSMAAFKLSK